MQSLLRHGLTAMVATLLIVPLVAGGCTATRGRRGQPQLSGFLGDYSQLQKSPDYPFALIDVRPEAQWSRYDSIELDSVTLWATPGTVNISPENQERLVGIFYNELYAELDKYFQITTVTGPNTLRVRAALTQAQGAKVALRTVSTVVPQLRAVGAIVGFGADTATTVGTATAEVEILDSVSNQRLAAAVDTRAGTKVLFAGRAYSTWGDVDAACKFWAERIAWQLVREGVQRRPGAPTPEAPKESRAI